MKNESSHGIMMSVAFLQADLNFYSKLNILLQQYNRNSLLLFFNYYFYHPQTFDEREKKKREWFKGFALKEQIQFVLFTSRHTRADCI